jgi:hypothetical protein
MGSAQDYDARFSTLREWGISLVNTPEEYARSSYLPNWYFRISEFTPRSVCFEQFPSISEIEASFDYPIFIKGERQTNQHSRAQCIITSRSDLERLLNEWNTETILWWQRLVCREFVPLAPVAPDTGLGLPMSYEFRSFWWRGKLAGIGRYWLAETYTIKKDELDRIREIGTIVSQRLAVPFLVIDFALSRTGHWLVIECNDGQDSGYAGVNPRHMWTNIIEMERR